MGRYGDLDCARFAKGGFLLGVGLFALGALGELAIAAAGIPAPPLAETLLFDMEAAGILIGPFAPLLFGIVLPLTE